MTKPGGGVKPPKVRISLIVGSRRIDPARLARGQPAEQAERFLTGTAYIHVRRTPAGVEPAGRGSP